MLLLRRRALVSSLIVAGSLIVCARQACAQRPALVDQLADPSERPARYTPTAISPTSLPEDHPLASVLRFARDEQNYLRRAVRDFTCRLVKRERIDGILQDYCHIDMSVREEVRGGAIDRPMSIYLQFLAPRNVAGRRVLYVAGQNEGKMLVRNGGRHFDYVVVEIDPWEKARKESLVPITQSGFNQVLGQMIDILQRHAQADPTGQNTRVATHRGGQGQPAALHRDPHRASEKTRWAGISRGERVHRRRAARSGARGFQRLAQAVESAAAADGRVHVHQSKTQRELIRSRVQSVAAARKPLGCQIRYTAVSALRGCRPDSQNGTVPSVDSDSIQLLVSPSRHQSSHIRR